MPRSFQRDLSNGRLAAPEKPQKSAIPAEQLDPRGGDQVDQLGGLEPGADRPESRKVSPRIPSRTVQIGALATAERISAPYFIRAESGGGRGSAACYRCSRAGGGE